MTPDLYNLISRYDWSAFVLAVLAARSAVRTVRCLRNDIQHIHNSLIATLWYCSGMIVADSARPSPVLHLPKQIVWLYIVGALAVSLYSAAVVVTGSIPATGDIKRRRACQLSLASASGLLVFTSVAAIHGGWSLLQALHIAALLATVIMAIVTSVLASKYRRLTRSGQVTDTALRQMMIDSMP